MVSQLKIEVAVSGGRGSLKSLGFAHATNGKEKQEEKQKIHHECDTSAIERKSR